MGGACWASPSASGGRSGRPGCSIDIGAAVDFARALTLVDIGDREQVRGAGAAIFVRRRDDRATYDAVFDRWWRRRGSRLPRRASSRAADRRAGRRRGPAEGAAAAASPAMAARRPTSDPTSAACRCPHPTTRMPRTRRRSRASSISPDAYSAGRGPAPPRVRPDDARASCARPSGSWTCSCRGSSGGGRAATSSTRTAGGSPPGRCSGATSGPGASSLDVGLAAPDPRAALARRPVRHLGLDGAPLAAAAALRPGAVRGVARSARSRSCSGRGSRASPGCCEDRDRDRALARVADAVNDWAGGTRIGESFRTFNQHVGAADAAHLGRRHRRLRRLGPRRSCARRDRDRPPAAQLPPPRLAQSAGRDARLPAAGRRACAPPTRTSTTSCRPGPSRTSSAWARSSAASGRATRDGAARPPRTRRSPGRRPGRRRAARRRRRRDRPTHPLPRPLR